MYDMTLILSLVKMRLNRLASDTTMDEYLKAVIRGAADKLNDAGVHLSESDGDVMLLVDYSVWRYHNRDNPNDMPMWLRYDIRQRWFKEGRESV